MLKYYNNLQNWDKQKLLKFLAKDPTWNDNKEHGQYSKWILDKLNRNVLDNSHLGHLHDTLKRFEDNKKYLKNKDINKFKSLQEIDTYLNDDNSYNELSHSQIVRQHRRDKQKADLDNEAKLIYEDSNWEIWIPKTYAASCKLGRGSRWCTASTETSSYFDRYSKDGNLYIILNKYNGKEKYQFHTESDNYMDINDEEIDLFDLSEEEKNKKWINALRQYNKEFDERCGDIINKAKKAREEFNSFAQKINSIEIIKYPTQKDIIKDIINKFKEFGTDSYTYMYLRKESDKINIKLEIENGVEEIKPFTFKGLSWIRQVSFEKNSKLKRIGEFAFANCNNLTSITIPNSVTSIGEYAFSMCYNLTSITIPSGVTSIGNAAFYGCSNLTSIIIPSSVTSISSYAFNSCISLTSIIIPEGVISIENGAFGSCGSLTNITIPSSVTSIGDYAFLDCRHLTSITISSGVTSIGPYVFYGCSNLLIKTSNQYVIDYCIENNIKYEKID